MSQPCWRCGSRTGLTADGWCYLCTRTPDRAYHEKVERLKAKQRGNPKTYGTYGFRRNPDLEGFTISLLAKMCRG
jgi:hypothetical protein